MKSELDETNDRDMILVEDDFVELQPEQVTYVEYMAIQRTFEKAKRNISALLVLISHLYAGPGTPPGVVA